MDIYFKILPRGTCGIAGCILGFPTLDVRPWGLGHSVQHTAHCFEEFGVALPRLELARRCEYNEALSAYLASGGESCSVLFGRPGPLSADQCSLLREIVFRHELEVTMFPVAVADCHGCLLLPQQEALVPAVWDRPMPEGAC